MRSPLSICQSKFVAYQEFLPDARLSHLVRNYFQVSENHWGGLEEHRFMPERLVRLTFSVGSTWQGSLLGGEMERMPDRGNCLAGMPVPSRKI